MTLLTKSQFAKELLPGLKKHFNQAYQANDVHRALSMKIKDESLTDEIRTAPLDVLRDLWVVKFGSDAVGAGEVVSAPHEYLQMFYRFFNAHLIVKVTDSEGNIIKVKLLGDAA